MKQLLDLTDPFDVAIWHDSVLDPVGVAALGPYAETFWLPVIGPTSYVLARRLLQHPEQWGKADLAAAFGLRYRGGPKDTLERSLARLEGFRLAKDMGDKLHVRYVWPRLTEAMLSKLPPYLKAEEPAFYASLA